MISKAFLYFLFICLMSTSVLSKITLQRYSISTYSNTNALDNIPGYLGVKKAEGNPLLSVIRVGFRQYENPNINSSSSLSLDNRLTLVDGQETGMLGDILFYPNPFRLQTGAKVQYWLNKPSDISIHIYDMFGHQVFRRVLLKGMKGARYKTNVLTLDASVFNYYNASAGVYFLYIFDDQNKLIGKSKFAIIP